MKIVIRNQTCHLLAEKAVYWEDKKILILADMHIGKETVFRKSGIPLPQGIMDEDLMNLRRLVHQLKAEKCIIVGDLIHASIGISEDVRIKFSDWLHQIQVEVHLVMGNHDYSLIKNLPPEWPLKMHKAGLLIEPFYFSHIPMKHPNWFVWSGHVHPKIVISDKYDRIVLRCFQIFNELGILPAFGFFVGGSFVQKTDECQIYAIANDTVVKIHA